MFKEKKSDVSIVGIVLFCLSATFLASVQETNYEALLGEWDVQTEDGQFAFVFTFSLEEDTLTGMFEGPSGEVEMEDISFENNELMFTVTVDAGGQMFVVDFSATIEEDSMEGFLSMEMGEMNFSGKKRN
ncbi:MAG: hypothetical protein JSV17_15065 [Candidatus Aminicenantes bacterium]|nr:MAG: hypothetical protein JSV17_15065 [Candidatus Aminicenantes bacterium]